MSAGAKLLFLSLRLLSDILGGFYNQNIEEHKYMKINILSVPPAPTYLHEDTKLNYKLKILHFKVFPAKLKLTNSSLIFP